MKTYNDESNTYKVKVVLKAKLSEKKLFPGVIRVVGKNFYMRIIMLTLMFRSQERTNCV